MTKAPTKAVWPKSLLTSAGNKNLEWELHVDNTKHHCSYPAIVQSKPAQYRQHPARASHHTLAEYHNPLNGIVSNLLQSWPCCMRPPKGISKINIVQTDCVIKEARRRCSQALPKLLSLPPPQRNTNSQGLSCEHSQSISFVSIQSLSRNLYQILAVLPRSSCRLCILFISV